MRSAWNWLRRSVGAAYVLIAGLFGSGGHVIVDRRQMYGDDPANDPYSPDFDPNRRTGR